MNIALQNGGNSNQFAFFTLKLRTLHLWGKGLLCFCSGSNRNKRAVPFWSIFGQLVYRNVVKWRGLLCKKTAGIILAPDFCERKNPIWKKTVRFSNSVRFFFSLARTNWVSFFLFFFCKGQIFWVFFVKARFCIRIVCISIIIDYFVMYSKSG